MSFRASLPIVVVLPVPLTPTTRTTVGPLAARASVGGSPNRVLDLLRERLAEVTDSPRASSRRTSSAVAGTPTSARISATSSRSHASSLRRVERPAELCREGAATLPERVPQAGEEAGRSSVLRVPSSASPSSSAHVSTWSRTLAARPSRYEARNARRAVQAVAAVRSSRGSRRETIWEMPSPPIVTP